MEIKPARDAVPLNTSKSDDEKTATHDEAGPKRLSHA
jgi:hypothetical protein